MEILPPLPKQLEYDFVGRTLVVRDVDADVVVDFIPNAMPTMPAQAAPAEAAAKPQPPGAISPLPMPQIRGGTVFALMGDSGSGDQAQQAVAQAMLTYFNTARRFAFVLMLGDNLYDDDYTNEFSVPYKPLLDRGVKFYAALGNHDRDLEIHFKPFNMNDVDRYFVRSGKRALRGAEQQPSGGSAAAQMGRSGLRRRGHEVADRVLPPPALLVRPARVGRARRDPAGARTGADQESGERRLHRPRASLRADQAAARHHAFRLGRRRPLPL